MENDSQIQQHSKTVITRQWDNTICLEAAFEDADCSLITAALDDVAKSRGMTLTAIETGFGRER